MMFSVEDYLAEVMALVSPLPEERVALDGAVGRHTATDLTAREAVPPFDNSAMDGYAVRWADVAPGPVTLRVLGDVPAGSVEDPTFGAGECVRIMTGAPVPTSADTVVQLELTDRGTERVYIAELPHAGRGAHIRRAGEDVSVGGMVLPRGSRVDAVSVAALAASGWGVVPVHRRPRVALATTGDELRPAGTPLLRGQIPESNGRFLAAAARRDGAEVVDDRVLPDDIGAFVAALDVVTEVADLVVLSGGVSVGAYDVVRLGLEASARSAFRSVRMQPGKPQGWAVWRNGTPIVCLPGNPVSTVVSYEVFVRPMLTRLAGGAADAPWLAARADASWRCPHERRQYLPAVHHTDSSGVLRVSPATDGGSASHLATSLARATALVMVEEDRAEVRPDELVRVRLLS